MRIISNEAEKTSPYGDKYERLFAQLNKLDEKDIEQARAIGDQIKEILLSNPRIPITTETQSNRLIGAMQRFGQRGYDDLFDRE